jgi:hypothetical protein
MVRVDELKEQIGLNKFIMGLISVIVFSITGFTVTHYENIEPSLLIVIFISSVLLIYAFMIDKIKQLRDV